MKKFATITTAIVLTVAGCSASAVNAITKDTKEPKVTVAIIKTSAPTHSDMKFMTTSGNSKEIRNYARMQLVLKYMKTRVQKTPYVFSGTSNRYGWDCSGMVVWLYRHFGFELPHSATAQGRIGTRVSNPKVGDIVVFAYQGRTDFYHSAIYIGHNKVLNANRAYGTTVVEPLTNYKRSQVRFVRLVTQAK
jgi:cell wall-associated NlpC family hydrolase